MALTTIEYGIKGGGDMDVDDVDQAATVPVLLCGSSRGSISLFDLTEVPPEQQAEAQVS